MPEKPKHEALNPNSFNAERDSRYHYDEIARNFDHSWDGFLSSFFKRFIVKTLDFEIHSTILDIGCANGKLLEMLNEKKAIIGTGIDISPKMVRVASELYPSFTFKSGSAQQLPLGSESFDVITCSASFHHFPDPIAFLKEVKGFLKKDGRLVIAEIRIPVITRIYNRVITDHSYEGDVQVYSPKELQTLFFETGWVIQKKKISRQIQYYELTSK
ncbi:class I SAM-dependent methyltransferase [Lactovum miscens]|uniref:Ubiquinone/menaquinone biosynthesis C-methylase UbiE n=1 Tax=Lactovum miscens TaxID=190387 RepID=A0A841CAR3_9LACT|nr:class I SAM-dependent methyltransferase [Lactovum miscens]MBB5888652.1 ubiquinone/menaquinone biosynthesis C-methylase UbiE [Lactovum miscens]